MKHADIAVTAIRSLIDTQCPQWRDLEIVPVASSGTANTLFRLGDRLVVRVPRTEGAIAAVAKEHHLLPAIAARVSLAVPVPVFPGSPGAGIETAWSVYEWCDGDDAWTQPPADGRAAAEALAGFIAELSSMPLLAGFEPGRHNAWRGTALSRLDTVLRAAIAESGDRIDRQAVTRLWSDVMALPTPAGPRWLHGDLQPGNLLVRHGRLCSVIDWGLLGTGDPAADLLPAWNLLDRDARHVFRHVLGVDDDTWQRGRGWAVYQAVMALPYYWDTNPVMVRQSQRVLRALFESQPP